MSGAVCSHGEVVEVVQEGGHGIGGGVTGVEEAEDLLEHSHARLFCRHKRAYVSHEDCQSDLWWCSGSGAVVVVQWFCSSGGVVVVV